MTYFDDKGNELDPAALPMPQMCLMCDKKDDSDEEIQCNLIRLDQADSNHFKCGAFTSLYGVLIDDIIL